MGRHLDIDCSWILLDFGSQVGTMLGSKIDQKSIQKGIEKQMRKRRRKNRQRSASWAVLGRLGGVLGPLDSVAVGVRRIRVGQSKGQIRPFLSLSPDHATGSPAEGRGRRIVSASRTRRGLRRGFLCFSLSLNNRLKNHDDIQTHQSCVPTTALCA